jgi:threonine aldolase
MDQQHWIDLRSDTVTRPTPRMRRAMAEAEVGDDVIGEDPTANRLQAAAAERLGMEDALFVPSGTFGNQLALFTHCQRGDEVILADQSHVVQHEAGASAIIAGVQLRTVNPAAGWPTWAEVFPRLRRGEDIHYPKSGLVVLENALSNGEVMPLAGMEEVRRNLQPLGVPVHLDGARIFNAAASLGVEASRIASFTDSVMFCISKGLCAPVGSLLAGSREFVRRARERRKIMGGGMRQVGILAAAGLVALEEMVPRLAEDHRKAEELARALASLGAFEVLPRPLRINMLFTRFTDRRYAGRETDFVAALREEGILTYPPEDGWIRFVTHHDVSFEDLRAVQVRLPAALERIAAHA